MKNKTKTFVKKKIKKEKVILQHIALRIETFNKFRELQNKMQMESATELVEFLMKGGKNGTRK